MEYHPIQSESNFDETFLHPQVECIDLDSRVASTYENGKLQTDFLVLKKKIVLTDSLINSYTSCKNKVNSQAKELNEFKNRFESLSEQYDDLFQEHISASNIILENKETIEKLKNDIVITKTKLKASEAHVEQLTVFTKNLETTVNSYKNNTSKIHNKKEHKMSPKKNLEEEKIIQKLYQHVILFGEKAKFTNNLSSVQIEQLENFKREASNLNITIDYIEEMHETLVTGPPSCCSADSGLSQDDSKFDVHMSENASMYSDYSKTSDSDFNKISIINNRVKTYLDQVTSPIRIKTKSIGTSPLKMHKLNFDECHKEQIKSVDSSTHVTENMIKSELFKYEEIPDTEIDCILSKIKSSLIRAISPIPSDYNEIAKIPIERKILGKKNLKRIKRKVTVKKFNFMTLLKSLRSEMKTNRHFFHRKIKKLENTVIQLQNNSKIDSCQVSENFSPLENYSIVDKSEKSKENCSSIEKAKTESHKSSDNSLTTPNIICDTLNANKTVITKEEYQNISSISIKSISSNAPIISCVFNNNDNLSSDCSLSIDENCVNSEKLNVKSTEIQSQYGNSESDISKINQNNFSERSETKSAKYFTTNESIKNTDEVANKCVNFNFENVKAPKNQPESISEKVIGVTVDDEKFSELNSMLKNQVKTQPPIIPNKNTTDKIPKIDSKICKKPKRNSEKFKTKLNENSLIYIATNTKESDAEGAQLQKSINEHINSSSKPLDNFTDQNKSDCKLSNQVFLEQSIDADNSNHVLNRSLKRKNYFTPVNCAKKTKTNEESKEKSPEVDIKKVDDAEEHNSTSSAFNGMKKRISHFAVSKSANLFSIPNAVTSIKNKCDSLMDHNKFDVIEKAKSVMAELNRKKSEKKDPEKKTFLHRITRKQVQNDKSNNSSEISSDLLKTSAEETNETFSELTSSENSISILSAHNKNSVQFINEIELQNPPNREIISYEEIDENMYDKSEKDNMFAINKNDNNTFTKNKKYNNKLNKTKKCNHILTSIILEHMDECKKSPMMKQADVYDDDCKEILKKIEDTLNLNITTSSLDELNTKLEPYKEKLIAHSLVLYVSEEQLCKSTPILLPRMPVMSYHHQSALCFMQRLRKNPPVRFNQDFFELVMRNIEYKLFQLNNSPKNNVTQQLSTFYAIVCYATGQRERLKVFCMDALYCMSFKSISVVASVMHVWPRLFPKIDHKSAKDPLVIVMMHLITCICNKDKFKVDSLSSFILKNYGFRGGEYNDDEILLLFKDILKDLSNYSSKKSLFTALILFAKRCGTTWCHKKITLDLLIPILDNANSTNECKLFAVESIGALTRPYPASMMMQREIVREKLNMSLKCEVSPQVQEAIVRSLITISNKNYPKIMQDIIEWRPSMPISEETAVALKVFVKQKSSKFWQDNYKYIYEK